MASWRDAGWEEARPELGVTSNTQIGRSALSHSRQSLTSRREIIGRVRELSSRNAHTAT
jgi:hypothetical protein